jgi:signal transduction histidine kinase
VAVLFAPLRERLQRAVNHLIYGERDDPYAALARLGQRLDSTLAPEALLPTVVETVRDALRLPFVALALTGGAVDTPAAAAGEPTATSLTLPVTYRGEQVGQLYLAPRAPREPWSPADRRLLADLAHQAGVAVQSLRLTRDLQQALRDVQRSRERLVLAREEERRRLRRDLHDELAPTLAALALTAGTACDLLATDAATATRLVAQLHVALRAAAGEVRHLVYELRPPTLDELGLLAAIRERAVQVSGSGATDGADGHWLRVLVEAPEALPALPAAVEVAVYRIVQEALMNVVKHAQAHTCRIQLAPRPAALPTALEVQVVDDGVGLPAGQRRGVGLGSMRERAAELGGTCTIESIPSGGTQVLARLPILREA